MALVCSCEAVSDRRIRAELDRGAASISELAARCGAGSCCLSCHPTLEDLIVEHHARRHVPLRLALG